MKSLKELEDIRIKTLEKIGRGKDRTGTRIVVGMATCGIAAGARPVMAELSKQVQTRGLSQVTVCQTGCIGICRLEPIVEVYRHGEEKVTYVKVSPDQIARIVAEHVVNGRIVEEYTIGHFEKNNG